MREMVSQGLDQLQRAADVIRALAPDTRWRIAVSEHRSQRTTEQNKLLWAIYTEMAENTGYTASELHEAMKRKFLVPRLVKVGKDEIQVPGSSRELDTKEFSQFVERVAQFASEELGIVV
jgi:hypothetical protein